MGHSKALELRHIATPTGNPPAGALFLYGKSDGKLYTKDSAGVEAAVAGAGGGGGASGATLDATTDYLDTTPAAPTAGMKIFTRHRARRLPSYIGPSGQDSQLQPALFSNRVGRMLVKNGVTPPTDDGFPWTGIGTAAAVTNASSNFFNSMVRHRWSSTTTAGTACGVRSSSAQWFTSATANMGGMFAVCRFGLQATTATNRLFVGFSATNAALSPTVEPSTLFNQFGFGCDSTHTTMRFMYNDGTGVSTMVDLGANFPTRTAATYFYEFRIFVPSGGGNSVLWSAHRLNDGIVVNGGTAVVASGASPTPITTDLPAVGTMLAFHANHSNGTTATATAIDVQSIYVETDN